MERPPAPCVSVPGRRHSRPCVSVNKVNLSGAGAARAGLGAGWGWPKGFRVPNCPPPLFGAQHTRPRYETHNPPGGVTWRVRGPPRLVQAVGWEVGGGLRSRLLGGKAPAAGLRRRGAPRSAAQGGQAHTSPHTQRRRARTCVHVQGSLRTSRSVLALAGAHVHARWLIGADTCTLTVAHAPRSPRKPSARAL